MPYARPFTLVVSDYANVILLGRGEVWVIESLITWLCRQSKGGPSRSSLRPYEMKPKFFAPGLGKLTAKVDFSREEDVKSLSFEGHAKPG